jgi:hypothetical protein
MTKTVRVLAWAAVALLITPIASVSAHTAPSGSTPSTVSIGSAKATRPKAPAKPASALQGTSIRLTWKAPASGGARITDYKVECSSNKGKKWRTIDDGVRKKPGATVEKLKKGVAWTCRVSARNKVGWGPVSAASRPITIPPSDSPVKYPSAYVGTLSSTELKVDGDNLTTEWTVSNARFNLSTTIPLPTYTLVSGTARMHISGTTSEGCTVDHTTDIDIMSLELQSNTIVVRDARQSGVITPGTVGPIYYSVDVWADTARTAAGALTFPTSCNPAALGLTAHFARVNPPLDVAWEESASFTLTGSNSLTNPDMPSRSWEYTWNLSPVS